MSIPVSIRRKYLSNLLAIVLAVSGLQAIAISSAPTASALTWTNITGLTVRGNLNHIRTNNDGSVIGAVSKGQNNSNFGDLYLSRDSGASWTSTTGSVYTSNGLYKLAISGNGNLAIAGDDAYILRASYSGSAWSFSNRTWSNPTGSGTNQRCAGYGPNFNSLAASTDGSNWVAGARDEGCVYSSSDSGANWSNTNTGGTNYGSAISADGTIRVTSNSNGNLYRNSGSGWSAISTSGLPASTGWSNIACDSTCTKMAIGNYGGKIYTTSNSGANWSAGGSDNRNTADLSMSLDGGVIAITDGAEIYISKDLGATWSGEGQGGKSWTGVTVSGDGTKIYAAASDGTIRKADIPPTISVACSGGGSFSIESNVVTTSTLNCAGAVVIPAGVTSIASYAFYRVGKTAEEQLRITSVTIANSVISVGDHAFNANKGITSLTLGTGLTTIGAFGFRDLYALTNLVIPPSVRTIGTWAFADVKLTSLTLNEGLETIGGSAFLGNKLVTLVIPNSVTTISPEATFAGWGLIETLTLGSGLTTIGNRTFEGVSRLQSLTIPPGVTTLGTNAFRDYPQTTYRYCGTSLTQTVLDSAGLTGKTKTCPVAQTITRTSTSPTSPVKFGTYTPTATASSTLPVAITIAAGSSSVCSIASGVVTFNTVGSCIIQYRQSGNSSYSAATQVTENLIIGKPTPTFSAWSGVPKNYGDSAFTVTEPTVTGSVPGTFSYSSGSTSVISVSGTTLTVVGAGSSVITATFTPNDTTNYNTATTTMTVTVGKGSPTFLAWSGVSKNYGDSAFTVTAPTVTGSIPGSFSYSSATTSVITVSGTTLTVAGAGTSVITATFTPDDSTNYNSATINMTVTVGKATPTFSTWSGVSKNFGDSAFTVTAPSVTGSVPGSFSYSSATTSVISVSGTTLTVVGAGSSVITATFTPNDTTNYNSETTTMTVTVGKAVLSITASSHTVAYGDAIPTITPTYSGFVNGDTSSVVTAPICSTTYTTTTAVGSVASSCTGAIASNYSFTYTPGVITIEKAVQATLVGTAGQSMWAWVQLPFSSIATSGGNGTGAVKFTVASGPCAVSGTTLTATSGGTCSLIATKEADTNYLEESSAAFSFTVAKGTPTVTQSLPAGATTATFGTAVVITATVQYVGTVTFKAGTTEICNSVTANLTATCSWTPNSAVSTILTIDYVPTNTNWYNSRTAVGSLTINVSKAVLSITASSHTVAYGDAIPTITPTYSGFVNGDTSSVITPPTCSTTYTTTTAVGSVASSCTGAIASNYSFAYTAGVITVTQGGQTTPLVISSTLTTYGSTLSLTTSGGDGQGGNSFVVNSGPCTVSLSILTPTAVGTCMVSATKAANGNFLAASSTSTAITVNPKGLTISGLTGVNKEFSGTRSGTVTGTPTLVGKVGSDDVHLDGTPTFTFASENVATGIALTGAGYTLAGATAANYTLTQPMLTADITQKAARVAANNVTIAYGATVTNSAIASGLITADAFSSATYIFTGSHAGNGTSALPTDVGVYTVTPSNAVLSHGLVGNYSFTYDTATVTILAKYTITYNANGGEVSGGSTSTADFVVGDIALTLPTPTRANYTFTGWYTLQTNGVQVNGAYTPTATETLWARWIQNSLYGMGASTKILTITTLSGVGNTYSANAGGGTIAIEYLADALPAGTVIDAYVLSDTSTATTLIGAGNDYVMSLVLAWVATDGTVPTTANGKAISMTITNNVIKKGAKIYSVIGVTPTLLTTATTDGIAVISITDDPQIIIAITKPDAPTGVSATAGGGSSSTVTWIAPSDGGSSIISYTVTSNASHTCTTPTTSCTVTGLSDATSYTFTVTATNAIGTSDASAASVAIFTEDTAAIVLAAQQAAAAAALAAQQAAALAAQQAAAALAAQQAAAAEAARVAELARIAEEKRVAELARIAEEKRVAELARIAEEMRVAELARIAEEKRVAELARIAEEQRLAELARIAEEQRLAELARIAEEQRLAELARIAEEQRLAELARIARVAQIEEELAYKAEQERVTEQRKIEEYLQGVELARITEAARLAELTRIAEENRLAELARIAEKVLAEKVAAEAEALAAVKKAADELASQLKAEEELKAAAALKLVEEQRVVAERAVAAKRIATVYSTTATFKLNKTYTKRLNTNTKKIASGSTVTCIGYAKSSKTLSYVKAKVVATKQAKALCSSMKKINPTLKTKSLVYPASKAPKTKVSKMWIPVSYRVDTAVN